jgi:RNA polymerase sigma-70 factor (family 1)
VKENQCLKERELLLRTSEGDREAFSELFRSHWVHLFNYVKKITKSPEIAEEIVSDVFLKIWTNREYMKDVQSIDAFLMTIARNKAIDFFRLTVKNSKLKEAIAKEMEGRTERGADYLLLDKETKEILQKAIGQLSPQRRLVFMMSKEEGLSHTEIAQRMNLSHQTVKNTLTAALTSIKEYLKENRFNSYLSYLIIMDYLS